MAGSARTSHFTFIVAALMLVAFGSPAGAITSYAKFYSGGTGYVGTYDGSGSETTVYEVTKGLSTDCPTGGCGGPADQFADPMTFSGALAPNLPGSLSITGNGDGAKKVWDDLVPNFGGLGVGTQTEFNSQGDADQIADLDVLTLTFSSTVKLTGVGTLFASGHLPFSDDASFDTLAEVAAVAATMKFKLNGVDTSFLDANGMALALTGTTFTFEQKAGSPQFYVSALSYEICGPGGAGCAPGEVPIPGALPLFITGLGAMGLLGWRRKRKQLVR